MNNSLNENSFLKSNNTHKFLLNTTTQRIAIKNVKKKFSIHNLNRNSKDLIFIFQMILILTFLSFEISCFEYCCCLFGRDPFRGYNSIKSHILSFDHTNMDKESIGYKMINQCYRNYGGFPTLENINSLKRDIYSIDQKQCEKDCNYFIREINEKYNIKQEANREVEAKKLKEIRNKFLKILTEKIKQNTNSLFEGKPCKADINTSSNWRGNGSKHKKSEVKGNQFKVINSPAVGNMHMSSGSINSVPTMADLSIDSDDGNEPSYLQLDNPKYNIELKNQMDKKSE